MQNNAPAIWLIAMALGSTACSSTNGDGAEEGPCNDASVDTTDCTSVLAASGGDDTEAVQTALIEAASGDTICFCPGEYSFTKELSLSVPDATVRGIGATRDDVVFDYADQVLGDDGFTVTSDGFTIEHLSLRNTPGNGIVVSGAEDVTFRNLKVSWDAGSVTENGAYAVYPVKSTRVLVEDCEIVGAADAGIYVGQCNQAIVRNNVVHGNVGGIEVENTIDAEVYGNEAYDNTAGILAFVLQNLEQKEGDRSLIRDNIVYDNNRKNFAEAGTIVAAVPPGIGVLMLAAHGTEIRNNSFTNNKSTAVLAVSLETLAQLTGDTELDGETDPFTERTFVHDNDYVDNGLEPRGAMQALGVDTLENVIWDGIENPRNSAGAEFCLGSSPTTFRNFNVEAGGLTNSDVHTTDSAPHECEGTALEGVSW